MVYLIFRKYKMYRLLEVVFNLFISDLIDNELIIILLVKKDFVFNQFLLNIFDVDMDSSNERIEIKDILI